MRLPVSSRRDLPNKPGVYIFRNQQNQVLYVGKAINLKNRVTTYFTTGDGRAKLTTLVPQINVIEYIEVLSEFEALILESTLIKKFQPKYNTIAKDDKHPLYIVITSQTFPRVITLRKTQIKSEHEYVYGPFTSSRTVKSVLSMIRKIIPFCTSKSDKGRPCFHSFIGLCHPCPRYITALPPEEQKVQRKQYILQINLLKRLLSGKSNTVKIILNKLMRAAANVQDFEKAAHYRDAIANLEQLLQPLTPIQQYINNPQFAYQQRQQGIEELKTILNEQGITPELSQIDRMEAYDLSTLGGQHTTGSMVVFHQGEAAVGEYRHFKISNVNKHSDIHSMEEMLTRRLKHTEWQYPDLLIIDGGVIQLQHALVAKAKYNVHIPTISLAKREEIIIIPQSDGTNREVKLPRNSLALQAVQHIRDEAHRFSRKLHHKLRSKSFLDQ